MAEPQLTNDALHCFDQIKEKLFPNRLAVCRSPAFLIPFAYLGLFQLRFSYYLSQLVQQLNYIFADEPQSSASLLTSLSFFLFVGVFIALISGLLTEFSQKLIIKRLNKLYTAEMLQDPIRSGDFYWSFLNCFQASFLIEATFSLLYSIIVFIGNVSAWYFAFLCMIISRGFLYSSVVSFVISAIPIRLFGFTYGLAMLLSGIFSLLQYAFLRGPPQISNGVMLAMIVCCYLIPLYLFALAKCKRLRF